MRTPGDHGTSSDDGLDAAERSFRSRFREAAETAEQQTGRREKTEDQTDRALTVRIARIVGGFLLIFLGSAGLVLPGPGWIIIIIGLGLLPYTWAQRTVVAIRRKVPGVPDEGNVPLRTWIIMGVVVVAFTTASILWGKDLTSWIGDQWQSLTA